MSTNSTVAVVHTNGTVSQIYVHWDGYIEAAGKCLFENYATLEKVEALVALGNLSSLEARLAPDDDETHNFVDSADNVCVAYARDRGEEDQQAEVYASIDELDSQGRSEEYDYMFADGQWFVREHGDYLGTVKAALAEMGKLM
jgi:hypothetical protein